MLKRFVVAMLAIFFTVFGFGLQSASAVSQNIVLSQVQVGPSSTPSNEFIELYNNADSDVEVTNWCLYYASASQVSQIGSKITCLLTDNDSLHLFLPASSYAFFISTALFNLTPTIGSDGKFSATLAFGGGHVRIVDGSGMVVDKIGWGTAVSPEARMIATPLGGMVLQRKTELPINPPVQHKLQDTDDNSVDFEQAAQRTAYSYGFMYEVQDLCLNIVGIQKGIPSGYSVDSNNNCLPPPVDICTNIDGLQIIVPIGYALDVAGLCQPDACPNITGLQLVLPAGKVLDASGNCLDYDFCPNLSGIQATIPSSYVLDVQGRCMLKLLPIRLNELLANAVGSDEGNEFIELYNPNDVVIDLSLYMIQVGGGTTKSYLFPVGSRIEPKNYISFSNDDIAFTLVNSGSQVRLVSTDAQLIDESTAYTQSGDGMAWALIEGSWQYTNRPTPGALNMTSLVVDTVIDQVVVSPTKPCASNQYLNPETNRCRLLVTVGSNLTACKDGQYRSEETNRCRNIASDVATLTPCDVNQERNPDTNRCRLIASSNNDITPCKDGQERNPDTNRCRIVVSNVPKAAFAVEPVTDTAAGVAIWWALGGVGLVALMYGGWEWRAELMQLIRKIGLFSHSSK